MRLAAVNASELLDHMFAGLAQGQGGWIVTANLDFLRRHAHDPASRALYAEADVCVADGMPLVWVSWLQGDRLPERIAGSSLMLPIAARTAADGSVADGMPLVRATWLQGDRLPERIAGSSLMLPIAERAAAEGSSLYLLGGEPAANAQAAEVLRGRWPNLVIAGASRPMVKSPPSAADIHALRG